MFSKTRRYMVVGVLAAGLAVAGGATAIAGDTPLPGDSIEQTVEAAPEAAHLESDSQENNFLAAAATSWSACGEGFKLAKDEEGNNRVRAVKSAGGVKAGEVRAYYNSSIDKACGLNVATGKFYGMSKSMYVSACSATCGSDQGTYKYFAGPARAKVHKTGSCSFLGKITVYDSKGKPTYYEGSISFACRKAKK